MKMLLVILVVSILWLPSASAQDGNRLWDDDFSTRAGRWDLPQTAKGSITYQDETLVATINTPGYTIQSTPDYDIALERYQLTIDLLTAQSSNDGSFGVLLNYRDARNFYTFELLANGTYFFSTYKDNQSRVIASGKFDTPTIDTWSLSITYQDTNFEFLLNDAVIATYQDDTHTAGIFGIYAKAGNRPFTTAFDNLRVTDLP